MRKTRRTGPGGSGADAKTTRARRTSANWTSARRPSETTTMGTRKVKAQRPRQIKTWYTRARRIRVRVKRKTRTKEGRMTGARMRNLCD